MNFLKVEKYSLIDSLIFSCAEFMFQLWGGLEVPKFQVAKSSIHIITNLLKRIDQKSYFSNSSTCKMSKAPKVKVKEF